MYKFLNLVLFVGCLYLGSFVLAEVDAWYRAPTFILCIIFGSVGLLNVIQR